MSERTGVAPPSNQRLSNGEWHRMHPLTPLLRGGLFLLAVLGLVAANMRDRLLPVLFPQITPEMWRRYEDFNEDPVDVVIANGLLLWALLGVAVVLAVLVGAFYLAWRFHSFRISDDDVEVRRGILFRRQRRAPLDRVQGVNLTRPMIARLVGLAKLEVVVAGSDGNVQLEYLRTTNAESVRADILRLASGLRLDPSVATGAVTTSLGETVGRGIAGVITGDEPPVPEPESVVRIPVGRLIWSHLLSPSTFVLVVVLVGGVIGIANGSSWALAVLLPFLLGFGVYWVRSITRSFRYSIAPTADGIRITFGLLTTVTEILPPGRIHAIQVQQSILWRPFGWWTIRINRLTGRAANTNGSDPFGTVLPVGTLADVERVLRLVLPDVAEPDWFAVTAGVAGRAEDGGFTTTPGRGWITVPLSWRRNGFRLLDRMLLLRHGAIWRRLTVVPLARLQSIGVHQGPVDRMLRIADLRAHVVPGVVDTRLEGIDRTEALRLFERVAGSTAGAAGSDRSHRWAGSDSHVPDRVRQ